MKNSAFALAVLVLQAQAANAQQLAPSPEPKEAWDIEWTGSHCALTKGAQPGDRATLSLRVTPGVARPNLVLMVNTTTAKFDMPDRGKFALQLGPNGAPSVTEGVREKMSNAKVTILGLSPAEGFLAEFTKAKELSVQVGNEKVVVVMKGAAKAAQALRQCIDEQLTEWGVDPKVYATLLSQPEGDWRKQLRPKDNPPISLLRSSRGGTVLFRAAIGPDGSVQSCKVIQTSGNKKLDDHTCAVVTEKGKFKPAVGADGSPTAGLFVDAMVWQMPGRGGR